jgi:DNA-binding transcriptional LysR family regulator
MDLNELLIFYRVAQVGSFTLASKALGVPKSTVSRKVQDLEERLGVTLLRRTTRKIHLTDAGLHLFQGSRGPLADLESVTQSAKASQLEPRGRVKITAPADVGNVVLTRVLPEFIRAHPQLSLDFILTDRMVDLVGEGIDLALRIGQLHDSAFVARKIGTAASHLYAAPSFLKTIGPIRTPEDLEPHMKFRFSSISPEAFQTLRSGTRVVRLKVRDSVSIDSFVAIKELVVQGQGIALMPSFVCQTDARARKLRVVLESWHGRATPIQLLYARQRFVSPAVALVRDFLLTRLPAFFPD